MSGRALLYLAVFQDPAKAQDLQCNNANSLRTLPGFEICLFLWIGLLSSPQMLRPESGDVQGSPSLQGLRQGHRNGMPRLMLNAAERDSKLGWTLIKDSLSAVISSHLSPPLHNCIWL